MFTDCVRQQSLREKTVNLGAAFVVAVLSTEHTEPQDHAWKMKVLGEIRKYSCHCECAVPPCLFWLRGYLSVSWDFQKASVIGMSFVKISANTFIVGTHSIFTTVCSTKSFTTSKSTMVCRSFGVDPVVMK